MNIASLARSSGGRLFRLSAVSGLATGLAANGVLFAWRNPSTSVVQHVLSLRAKWRTVAGFTAAQEMAVGAHLVSSFVSANYTGGTDLSDPTTDPAYTRLDAGFGGSLTETRSKSVLASGNVRIATTAALAHAGAPVIQAQPFLWDSFAELAAAATVNKGRGELSLGTSDEIEHRFGSDAGFILRAPVALGAGGTGRLSVEVCWFER